MPSKPQVLQICYSYTAPFLYLSNQYANLFKDSPYDVVTVYLKGEPSEQVIQQMQGNEVIFLNLKKSQLRGLKLHAILQIAKLHKERHFAFCVCQRHQALYIATHIRDLKVIGVLHGFNEYKRLGRRLWAMWHQKKLALLGVSDAVRDELRERLPRFPQNQIQTLHNSVNPQTMIDSLFPRLQAREELGLGDYFWFVNVARLVPDKDQATLIRGFAEVSRQLPQVRLAIFGAGRLEADLKTLVSTENIDDKVLFLGNVQRCYRYLPGFDSFVLTSAREAFGMVLLEAMLAGLPVIASDLKGVSEVVGNLAWRFKVGDPGLLAKQLSSIYLLSPEERKKCASDMLQHVTEHYSTESMRRTFWRLPFLKDWGL